VGVDGSGWLPQPRRWRFSRCAYMHFYLHREDPPSCPVPWILPHPRHSYLISDPRDFVALSYVLWIEIATIAAFFEIQKNLNATVVAMHLATSYKQELHQDRHSSGKSKRISEFKNIYLTRVKSGSNRIRLKCTIFPAFISIVASDIKWKYFLVHILTFVKLPF